ncbi:hypothetical protein FRC11_001350 [Ceratobasidium sp. 423]|nr:hypothetical protein FRC11_001350 [Ceratobasidium sp. 423]
MAPVTYPSVPRVITGAAPTLGFSSCSQSLVSSSHDSSVDSPSLNQLTLLPTPSMIEELEVENILETLSQSGSPDADIYPATLGGDASPFTWQSSFAAVSQSSFPGASLRFPASTPLSRSSTAETFLESPGDAMDPSDGFLYAHRRPLQELSDFGSQTTRSRTSTAETLLEFPGAAMAPVDGSLYAHRQPLPERSDLGSQALSAPLSRTSTAETLLEYPGAAMDPADGLLYAHRQPLSELSDFGGQTTSAPLSQSSTTDSLLFPGGATGSSSRLFHAHRRQPLQVPSSFGRSDQITPATPMDSINELDRNTVGERASSGDMGKER